MTREECEMTLLGLTTKSNTTKRQKNARDMALNALDALEQIRDFIEDNYPTEINTDWERGAAYMLDEIEKICKE